MRAIRALRCAAYHGIELEARRLEAQRKLSMKRIRYSKYVPDPAGEMSMEDLLSALSDYLLQSGFQDSMWYEMPEGEQTLEN